MSAFKDLSYTGQAVARRLPSVASLENCECRA